MLNIILRKEFNHKLNQEVTLFVTKEIHRKGILSVDLENKTDYRIKGERGYCFDWNEIKDFDFTDKDNLKIWL